MKNFHSGLRIPALLVLGAPLFLVANSYAQTTPTQTTTVNADIARAIQEITGRTALPEEQDPARYGLSYNEIKTRVANVYLPCDDAQISQAILEVTGRPARGLENQGECNNALYNNGRWENYDDLKAKVRLNLVTSPYEVGSCRLDEVTKAITEVKRERGLANVKPSGAGELGECNSYLYGGGVWSSEADLKAKVAQRLSALQAAGMKLNPDNSVTPIASRGGNSGKWFAVAGAVFSALAQWKADEKPKEQPMMQMQQGMGQPMMGMPQNMPQQPMGGLQPNMMTPEMMQQMMQMMQQMQAQQGAGMPQQGQMMPGMQQPGMMPQQGMMQQPGMTPPGQMMPGMPPQGMPQPGMMQQPMPQPQMTPMR